MARYHCSQCNADRETEKWPSGVDKVQAFSPEEIVRVLECGHTVPVDQEPIATQNDANFASESDQSDSSQTLKSKLPREPVSKEERRARKRAAREKYKRMGDEALDTLLNEEGESLGDIERKELTVIIGSRTLRRERLETLRSFGIAIGIFLVPLVGYQIWKLAHAGLVDNEMVSYERQTLISASSNWLPGETMYCTSVTLDSKTANDLGKPPGYALSGIDCDNGPVHDMKVTFYGNPVEPQYELVYWNCTRNQETLLGGGTTFTCKQAGGVRKDSGASRN